MPIIRYQVRNEYGLADPDLYGAADKDDPEALLEGVAMAGLVGVLRQLGDLAEFAAEIFHDLHEEVMSTASRGHALMLRVQQLEAEFPAIEKGFFSQTGPSNFTYDTGIDWHPNVQIDQNLITREDMPRFILDSYEEGRGPPRLFMLDKFDIAGDGACLKRYSDPSFFKMDFAASGKMEPDIQREKRSRKNKKKMQRGRNGETPETYITPHTNLKLESVASEKTPENPLIKRVKLRRRQLKEKISIGSIYMEHILEKQSADHTHLCDNAISNSQVKVNSAELAPEVREVTMDTSTCKPFSRVRNQTELHREEEPNLAQKTETVPDKKDSQILKNDKQEEVEKLPPTFHKADQKELLDEADCKREVNDDAESRTNGSLDGYISDDVASELDSYLDALTTMDSEIETDNETKAKPEASFFSKEYTLGCNANEQRRLTTGSLDSHTLRKSSSTQNSLSKGMPGHPNGDSVSSLANATPSDGASRPPLGMFVDAETPADETLDTISENNKADSEVSGDKSSIDLPPVQMRTDIGTLTESVVESSNTHMTETTVGLIHSSLHSSPGDVQSDIANQNVIPSTVSTENTEACHAVEYTPPNLDVQEAAEDSNALLSNPFEGHSNGPEKILEDDLHWRSEESRSVIIEGVYVNPGPISKNTENLSGTVLHLGDESDLKHQIQDDPSLETQVAVPCTEELSSEGVTSMSSDPSSTQMHEAINLETETSSSTCVEDLPLPLSVPPEEELHGSVCQNLEVDLAESTLSRKCPIPPDNNPSMFDSDSLLRPADNSVLSNAVFECEKSSISFEDAADFAENKVPSPENMEIAAENEGINSGISSLGPFFDMRMSQESFSSDQMEFKPKDDLPDIIKVPPNASAYETGDSPVSTGDHSNLISSVMPFSSPMELLPADRDSPCLVTEHLEADKLCSETLYSQESSSNHINLQEESFFSDSVSEQQKLEAAEAFSLKDLMDVVTQQVLCTPASQEEPLVVTGPRDSESVGAVGHILDSSSHHNSVEHCYDCHSEAFEHAEEDLCPTDGNKATAISLEEVGGEVQSPNLDNESKSIDSGLDHYLGNIDASNSEDLTGADHQKASSTAFLHKGEDEVITIPGDSESREPVDDSFVHTDLKPPMYVLCQEDTKSALSPQNSTADRLLEPSDTVDFESVKDAELLEANKVITYTLESQVSHTEPLLSGEACQTESGDVCLSDVVNTESISPSKEVFTLQSSNEFNEILLQQKFGRLSLSDIQLERGQPLKQDDEKVESQPLVSEAVHDSVEVFSSHKIYQLGITSTNESNLDQQVEVDFPLQSSFGISACSAIPNASLASLQTFPSLGGSCSTMILPQSSELPLDENPPLPPLPPLQWRVGKLHPSSFVSNGEMAQPQSGPNHLTALPSFDHSGGSLVMDGAGVQPLYPLSQVHELPNNSNKFGYQALDEEGRNPFQQSALSPAVEAHKCQDDEFAVDVQLKHLPANSSSEVSYIEHGQQNHELYQEVLSEEMPQSLNPFTSPLPLADVRSQQLPTMPEGEPIEQPKSSASLPTLLYSGSELGTAMTENATVDPSNPFLSSTSTEIENYHYSSGTFGVRMVQHQNFPDSLSKTEIEPPYILISQGQNTQAFESATLSTEEYGKPNGRLRSLLNRPRDPLIEAVASHDKSTLRRVSDLVRPSAKTEGERNSLLEQIRNKSFNLKPATVTKPNMKGPPTNLKVAAILEKANAIRQAFVGSDEDDDGDSWSDT